MSYIIRSVLGIGGIPFVPICSKTEVFVYVLHLK